MRRKSVRPVTTRGFEEVIAKLLHPRGGVYYRSCFNCAHYRKEPGDDKTLCQNHGVTSYDMINSSGSICCIRWEWEIKKDGGF